MHARARRPSIIAPLRKCLPTAACKTLTDMPKMSPFRLTRVRAPQAGVLRCRVGCVGGWAREGGRLLLLSAKAITPRRKHALLNSGVGRRRRRRAATPKLVVSGVSRCAAASASAAPLRSPLALLRFRHVPLVPSDSDSAKRRGGTRAQKQSGKRIPAAFTLLGILLKRIGGNAPHSHDISRVEKKQTIN